MIAGDERKPMSVLERISGEPCDPEPFIDYMLDHYRGHRDYWASGPNDRDADKPTARECVLVQLSSFIYCLEDLKRKMHRPLSPESQPHTTDTSPTAQD